MTKPIQHAKCDHPRTVAARNKCRAYNCVPPAKGSQMEKIARVVNNLTEPASTRQVMEAVGSANYDIIRAYLYQLVNRRQIRRVGPGLFASLDHR
jgi:hypothetical protein